MLRILKITATLLLAALPAGAALGQNFSPRDQQSDGAGYNRRRSDNGSQQDSSGYNRRNRDSGFSDSNSNSSKSSFGSKPTTPTDQPLVVPKSTGSFIAKPLPADLVILTTRSIFSRDHRAVAAASERPKPIFPSDVSKLIFKGAMRANDHYEAFIEDSAGSKPAQWVTIGQTLTANGGSIIDITLDHIVVEKGDSVRQIEVSDTLDGGKKLPGPPVTASLGSGASLASPNSSGASTGSAAAGNSRPTGASSSAAPAVTASTTGTASDDDVAEMMRRRRVQELGQ